jgi:outer membrane immunogenic protein
MKIKSTIVVAAAAGSAMAPNAQAADMPVKAQKMTPAPTWNWTGLYIGGHLGVAWQDARTTGAYVDDAATSHAFNNRTGDTGFLGGGQIGYNWQWGNFVYGVEADISKLSGSGVAAQTVAIAAAAGGPAVETSTNETRWIGTVRGRLGAVFNGNNLIYVTGGWAYGRVSNTHTEFLPANGPTTATWVENSTRSGYAIGGGIERMITNNWMVRVEGMYIDLGDNTVGTPNTGTCPNPCVPVVFENKATIARAAVNYKF